MDLDAELRKIRYRSEKWSLETFLASARLIHGNSFDYSNISEDDIQSSRSFLEIICNTCEYVWNVRLNEHIGRRSNCPSCNDRRILLTLRIFIEKSISKHGKNKWDYSLITENHVIKARNKVPLICKTCKTTIIVNIGGHLAGTGCMVCYKQREWTLAKFLIAAKEIHGNKYDYSQIKEEDANHHRCRLKITCNKCKTVFCPQLKNHISRKQGCPYCKCSHGETVCAQVLESLGIKFTKQYRLDERKRFYDFYFVYEGRKFLMEYDGEQHFGYKKFFHDSEEKYREKQNVDIEKTRAAIEYGFSIIRIDYKQFKYVEYHITQAFKLLENGGFDIYVSDEKMYMYILSEVAKGY